MAGKGFHLICAKCGSLDIWFKEHINLDDRNNKDENYTYTSCNNCSELTGVDEHNEYLDDWKDGMFHL